MFGMKQSGNLLSLAPTYFFHPERVLDVGFEFRIERFGGGKEMHFR